MTLRNTVAQVEIIVASKIGFVFQTAGERMGLHTNCSIPPRFNFAHIEGQLNKEMVNKW